MIASVSSCCAVSAQTIIPAIEAARSAVEPVFTIADSPPFQSFKSVFQTGLEDPALLSALMLTLRFAVNGENLDTECLMHKTLAITWINKRLDKTREALTNTTVGAILLLIGIEVCTLLWLI